MALRTSARKLSCWAGSTIETGRLFQSGVAMRASTPSRNERASLLVRAISASVQFAYSPTISTDCTPERAAVSSFSSNEPLSVHSITELVILAVGGGGCCGFDAAAPARNAAPLFKSSLRCIGFYGNPAGTRGKAAGTESLMNYRGDFTGRRKYPAVNGERRREA